MGLESITIALDWTLNTNHTGFVVAKALGYYEKEGLQVHLIEPGVPYVPPAERVRDGSATFAVAPSETAISSRSQKDKPMLQAVAALLSEDTSAIVTLKSSGLDTPKELEGKCYASYGARYEGRIVQRLIENSGGVGSFKEVAMPAREIWDAVLKGEADATWIFLGHEGVQAEMEGVRLNVFKLSDYDIPYGFTPILVGNPETMRQRVSSMEAFFEATGRGYEYAAAHPQEAAALLVEESRGVLDKDFAVKSQEFASKHYCSASGRWGYMEPQRWQTFLEWLHDSELLTTAAPSRNPVEGTSVSLADLLSGNAGTLMELGDPRLEGLFTNEYLPDQSQA
ncbi:hypothetical protein CVIRNUC_001479 [Coccomyxa viridis]|uniref:Thiamine pyrimidine synthase n=1 Tax=Coccomyxa viridis TaxID=1274662 RepID=A0AAV1HXB2_9CHLO|nr:hypothetical protein CVIRNUC_001479 [Coccomyxa viridis]